MKKSKLLSQQQILTLSKGQVWHYEARKGEEDSTLTINHIDYDDEHRAIYHLSIDGIRIQPSQYGLEPVTQIHHLPVAENALIESLTELEEAVLPLNGSEEGYASWKSAYKEGNAGVFSIRIAEIINNIERSIHPLH